MLLLTALVLFVGGCEFEDSPREGLLINDLIPTVEAEDAPGVVNVPDTFEDSPLGEVPSEDLPFEDTPFEDTPFEDPPLGEVPSEDLPFEDTPFEDPAFEDSPLGEVPSEDIPFEDTYTDDDEGEPAEGIAQGDSCKDLDVVCASGLECIEYLGFGGPAGGTFATCEIPCDVKTLCPEGQTCTQFSDGPGLVCI